VERVRSQGPGSEANSSLKLTAAEQQVQQPGELAAIPELTAERSLGRLLTNGSLATRARLVTRLQRTVGNSAVVHHVLQREPPASPAAPPAPAAAPDSPRGLIDQAKQSQKAEDIMKISDFGPASEDERVLFINILVQSTEGPVELRHAFYNIWSAFGDLNGIAAAATRHLYEFQLCVQRGMKFDPELWGIARAERDAFVTDIKELCTQNLEANHDFVQKRAASMGVVEGGEPPLSDAEITALRRDIQAMAFHVWSLLQSQRKLTTIRVGDAVVSGKRMPATFDPAGPHPESGVGEIDQKRWGQLKAEWDEAENEISDVCSKYPEVYEAKAEGEQQLLDLSRIVPDKFGEREKQLMQTLFQRVDDAQRQINDDDLDYLGLSAAHAQLFAGKSATAARKWGDANGFDQWAAKRLVADHADAKEKGQAFVGGVETVLLLVATFASGGMALALVGLSAGLSAAQAVAAASEASKLETVSKSTPLKGTALVTQAEVDAKKIEAADKLVEATVTLLAAGADLLGDEVKAARLKSLVGDSPEAAAALERLRVKVPDATKLEGLLQKSDGAGELDRLLGQVPDVDRLGQLLDARANGRARLRSMRGQYGDALAKDESLQKRLDGIEQQLKDVNAVESASTHLEQLEADLAKTSGQQMLETGWKTGEQATPDAIRQGTVRMEDHPDFQQVKSDLASRGFELRDGDSARVVIREVLNQDGDVVRVERYVLMPKGSRFLDLEHEVGHVRQLTENFAGKPPPTERVIEMPDGSIRAAKDLGGVLNTWQNSILEYHNRLDEFLRLQARGVDEALLKEHAQGVAKWRKEAIGQGMTRGITKPTWTAEHVPDLQSLSNRYAQAGGPALE
jgi:hypothetical protein